MDVSTLLHLHTLTEDLAAFLSEVTPGDLRRRTRDPHLDVGDLYLRIIEENLRLVATITGEAVPREQWPSPSDGPALDVATRDHGDCGLDSSYRRTARLVENAFASAGAALPQPSLTRLYEDHLSSTVRHNRDLAEALALPYQPTSHVARAVLGRA
ncbi:hypothetical protein [Salana multivorans]